MLNSTLVQLLSDPTIKLKRLMPVVRIEDNVSMHESIEIYKSNGQTNVDRFLATVLKSFNEGYWFDDSGSGLSGFLPDDYAAEEATLDEMNSALENRIGGYLKGKSSMLEDEARTTCYRILNEWNRKVFLMMTGDGVFVAFCYSTSD